MAASSRASGQVHPGSSTGKTSAPVADDSHAKALTDLRRDDLVTERNSDRSNHRWNVGTTSPADRRYESDWSLHIADHPTVSCSGSDRRLAGDFYRIAFGLCCRAWAWGCRSETIQYKYSERRYPSLGIHCRVLFGNPIANTNGTSSDPACD